MLISGLLFIGLLAGILGALMGLGGGIFLVPLLTIVFDLPIRTAVGTSLIAVIATSAGVAAFAPPGRGADVPLALRLEVASAACAIAGGWLAGKFEARLLHFLFALVVFLTASFTLYKSLRKVKSSTPERLFRRSYHPTHWPLGISASGLAGFLSGLLGVGGGFLKVPVMYAVMDVPLGVATATSNFMIGITAAASVFVYYGRGDIFPSVVVPTALGVFAGAMLGAFVLSRVRASWLRTGLIGLLFLMGAQMLIEGLNIP
jgi:uncharacterized membrane protein YfcA